MGGNEIVPIQSINDSGERYNDLDGIHHRRLEVWSQRGFNIDGEAANDESGSSVSVSGDGLIVAIGTPLNDAGGTTGDTRNKGHVRVYIWVATAYIQRGSDIDGPTGNDRFGTSVSLSYDGSVLAVGAPEILDGAGAVRVYTWNDSNNYVLRADINGLAADDQTFGTSNV